MEIDPQVRQLLFDAIDEVNLLLPPKERLARDLEVELVGPGAGLDSLGLINLIAAVENGARARFGRAVGLAERLLAADDTEPYRTVAALGRSLGRLLESPDGV